MRQRIWVPAEITFRITIRVPFSPDLLFMLTEISHLSRNKVYKLVQSVWQDQGTLVTIDKTIHKYFPNITLDKTLDIPGFLATMRVELLEMNEGGGISAPQYNIYANGEILPELQSLKQSPNRPGQKTIPLRPHWPTHCTSPSPPLHPLLQSQSSHRTMPLQSHTRLERPNWVPPRGAWMKERPLQLRTTELPQLPGKLVPLKEVTTQPHMIPTNIPP
jgi:hypothetical protein